MNQNKSISSFVLTLIVALLHVQAEIVRLLQVPPESTDLLWRNSGCVRQPLLMRVKHAATITYKTSFETGIHSSHTMQK
ncbi:hypothetical protein BKA82DRAFT_992605 [Pisolithus tinctorius]|uniref:Secreted protein n=1 Tax=Pisolithus tinctorius Marx 270 TaxID=870435 RepID=A0A0C3PYN3_PISTI|nr:hypothetical protein BKA82DRAFT_992605 [Pisolithus tinctorius]KIO14334.1 hypothetical protein M404DRAFT_992605 [Pisolithus tinctorius Marx 270]